MTYRVTDKFIKILLCAGFIFATLTAGEHGNSEETTETADDEKDKDKKKESGKSSYLEGVQSRYFSRLPYIMVPIMNVSIIKKGVLIGYLTIMPQLKGNSVESYRKLQAEIIKIKDEIFCDLFYAMSRLWVGPEPPSAAIIEGRIKKKLKVFFKEDLIERVNLQFMKFSIFKLNFKTGYEDFKVEE